MTGYCDLPMGRHDFAALGSPAAVAGFATFVKRERELAALLGAAFERDERMLAEMAARTDKHATPADRGTRGRRGHLPAPQ